nr:RNA-directed DNA polymerase, eukaryota, reverse transcriptase zinc-binding domain protein [Tanacetum cinerariifolium]
MELMGGINDANAHRLSLSNWGDILSSVHNLKLKANRVPIPDWSSVLRRHPRGGVESSQFEALQVAIRDVILIDHCDSWQWSRDVSPGFSVAYVRSLVELAP